MKNIKNILNTLHDFSELRIEPVHKFQSLVEKKIKENILFKYYHKRIISPKVQNLGSLNPLHIKYRGAKLLARL